MINVRKYRDVIVSIVNSFPETIEKFEIVPSISDWCRLNEIEDKNHSPFTAGMCLCNRKTKKYLILLVTKVLKDQKQSILDRIILGGSNTIDVALLKDDELFIRHLVFHECAHALFSDFEDPECDAWAFEQIKNKGLIG
jgi:hypothetical protein